MAKRKAALLAAACIGALTLLIGLIGRNDSTTARARDAGRKNNPAPQSTIVELARHVFGQTREPDAVLVSGAWGSGRREFGVEEHAVIGPSAFDVGADGSIVVLDQWNKRLVVYSEGRSRAVPIRFDAGEGDVAIGPGRIVYVLESGVRHAISAYTLSGRLLYRTPGAGEELDFVRVGPKGPIAWGFPGEMWFPVAENGRPLAQALQIAKARSAQTFPDGSEVEVRALPGYHKAHYQLRGKRSGSWLVRSESMQADIQLAQPYGSGLAVVMALWTERRAEYLFLELGPGGLGQSFAIEPVEHFESNASGRFRLRGHILYQLRSARTKLEIGAFKLNQPSG